MAVARPKHLLFGQLFLTFFAGVKVLNGWLVLVVHRGLSQFFWVLPNMASPLLLTLLLLSVLVLYSWQRWPVFIMGTNTFFIFIVILLVTVFVIKYVTSACITTVHLDQGTLLVCRHRQVWLTIYLILSLRDVDMVSRHLIVKTMLV